MKKILGITISMMLGISMIGCESTESENTTVEEPKTKQEAQIEEKEDTKEVKAETKSEKKVENKVLTFDNEEFKYYMTTNLPDEEYVKYFDSIKWTEDGEPIVVEFDGSIDLVAPREGYDTRMEVLLSSGDYSETEMNGPYLKDKDIYIRDLNGMISGHFNVKIKATIDKYDVDRGYLLIDIKSIESR